MCYYFSKSKLACAGQELSSLADAAEEKNREINREEKGGELLEREECTSHEPERKCA